jgi:hypothetical protein
MSQSTLEKLPSPDEIHRELVATLARVATLRKLFRLAQKAQREKDEAGRPRTEAVKEGRP